MDYIIIDETNRVTAASRTHHCGESEIEVVIPDTIPLSDIHDYKYENGEFIYNPLPKPEEPDEPEPGDSSDVWDELDAAYQEGVNSAYDQ